MKSIQKSDIENMNSIIMELPAFRNLKSTDGIKEILNIFLEQIYINQPQELFDEMNFILNDKLIETYFKNYGIDSEYHDRIHSKVKGDLAFRLEQLFQGKGSKVIFKILAELLEEVFHHINFYNVEVHKNYDDDPSPGLPFRLEYKLRPIYITDESMKIELPQLDIEKTRKYLMDLYDFRNMTMWPVSTDLVYIQFVVGPEIIDNKTYFLNAARMYANTFLSRKTARYYSKSGVFETICLNEIEILIQYFTIATLRLKHPDYELSRPVQCVTVLHYLPDGLVTCDPNSPDYVGDGQCSTQSSCLPSGEDPRIGTGIPCVRALRGVIPLPENISPCESFMVDLLNLLDRYSKENCKNRDAFQPIKTCWQNIMKLYEHDIDKICTIYKTYDELENFIKSKYPNVYKDFHNALTVFSTNPTSFDLISFYFSFYETIISGIQLDTHEIEIGLDKSLVIAYVDAIFSQLYSKSDFKDAFLTPILDLFMKYFFPVEMEYLNDLINHIFIKNKMNCISYKDVRRTIVIPRHFSFATDQWGRDYQKFKLLLEPFYTSYWTYDLIGFTPEMKIKDTFPKLNRIIHAINILASIDSNRPRRDRLRTTVLENTN